MKGDGLEINTAALGSLTHKQLDRLNRLSSIGSCSAMAFLMIRLTSVRA
jgi:hypothetical protein